jgi:hypothetical protein
MYSCVLGRMQHFCVLQLYEFNKMLIILALGHFVIAPKYSSFVMGAHIIMISVFYSSVVLGVHMSFNCNKSYAKSSESEFY